MHFMGSRLIIVTIIFVTTTIITVIAIITIITSSPLSHHYRHHHHHLIVVISASISSSSSTTFPRRLPWEIVSQHTLGNPCLGCRRGEGAGAGSLHRMASEGPLDLRFWYKSFSSHGS